MKKLFSLTFLLFLCITAFSQEKLNLKFTPPKEVNTDAYDKLMGDGHDIKYSDLATFNNKFVTEGFTSYIGKDRAVYKIGDKLKIGFPSSGNSFAFIRDYDPSLSLNLENFMHKLDKSYSGDETEIIKIFVLGNEPAGYSVSFNTKSHNGSYNYDISIENAIAASEIKSFGMTSDDALNNLKKAKDKLDLGLITQQEYNKIKTELVKYIK